MNAHIMSQLMMHNISSTGIKQALRVDCAQFQFHIIKTKERLPQPGLVAYHPQHQFNSSSQHLLLPEFINKFCLIIIFHRMKVSDQIGSLFPYAGKLTYIASHWCQKFLVTRIHVFLSMEKQKAWLNRCKSRFFSSPGTQLHKYRE